MTVDGARSVFSPHESPLANRVSQERNRIASGQTFRGENCASEHPEPPALAHPARPVPLCPAAHSQGADPGVETRTATMCTRTTRQNVVSVASPRAQRHRLPGHARAVRVGASTQSLKNRASADRATSGPGVQRSPPVLRDLCALLAQSTDPARVPHRVVGRDSPSVIIDNIRDAKWSFSRFEPWVRIRIQI